LGQGRRYGAALVLEAGLLLLTGQLQQQSKLDETTGVLTAQAGTTLEQIIDQFLAQGWFPSVVPGTKFVSLGGCVAADIHGKNHHRDGAIGSHVREFEIVLADGSRKVCSPANEQELVRATAGGMGLPGIITEVTLPLI